jgi:predicted MFS family arabinose efflux permease
VLLSATLGLATFMMVWLIQPYMQSRGASIAWLGPLWAGAHLYLAVVSLFSGRLAARFGAQSVFLGCCGLIALGYGGLAYGTSMLAIAFYLCFMTVRGLQGPILTAVLQADAPGDLRASVLSLNALVFRLGFAVIGPPVGALVDRAGMEFALVWLGIAFTAASLAALVLFRRAHHHATESLPKS